MKKDDLVIPIGILVLIMFSCFFVLYCVPTFSEIIEHNIIREQLMKQSCNESYTKLEQHKFYLKETSIDNIVDGKITGSHILIAGSIYGEITENKYINIIYFDDDTVIDDTIGVYKMTKFNLESIEITTIPKNETPYFKYVKNDVYFDEFYSVCVKDIGNPRLFLSEGWTILNTN